MIVEKVIDLLAIASVIRPDDVQGFAENYLLSSETFSPDLKMFLSENMKGCLIKVVTGENHEFTSRSLQQLVTFYESVPASLSTFAVRTYSENSFRGDIADLKYANPSLDISKFYVYQTYKVARHTSCYAHLHFCR